MVVIALTAFVGLALVTFFIVLFVCYMAGDGSIEHEALLPLEDEQPMPVRVKSSPFFPSRPPQAANVSTPHSDFRTPH
jgi:hypothetical protein